MRNGSKNGSDSLLGSDEPESERIIDEALHLASITTRLLVAWHSGEADAEVSMQNLWDGFWQIRSVPRSDLNTTKCTKLS
jgi:hypothetical protein